MATTTYPINDAMAIKLWTRLLDHEALKYTDIGPLIGRDANSIIHWKTETSKGKGDQVTFSIRMQLAGEGFSENDLAEGNGESLSTYSDQLTINELGHVVGVKSEDTIDAQRVPFNLREESKDGLRDWYAKRFSVAFFNQACGYTLQSNTKYTGLNAVIAASATRIIRQANRASDDLLVAGDTFDLTLIDKAKEAARVATPPIRPVMFRGSNNPRRRDFNVTAKDKFVVYMHPYQATDVRLNTSNGQWQDLQKAAWSSGRDAMPIYSGALGEYNSAVLREAIDVTTGISATNTDVPSVRRAVFLGGQACMIGFGMRNQFGRYRWNEELFDHKRRLEVSAWSIHGLKKTVYNSVDYGTIVLATYAVAH